MVERFFLDGIHLGGGEFAVGQGIEFAVHGAAHAAASGLAFRDQARVRAEVALDPAFCSSVPVPGRFHGYCLA